MRLSRILLAEDKDMHARIINKAKILFTTHPSYSNNKET
jgi:hypothetical protein